MLSRIKKHWKPIIIWTLLIALYAYWQLIPEVSIINGTGQPLKHVEIVIPNDDKVYRNILPGDNKSFRYHPARADGVYQVRVILNDDRIIKQEARLIRAWNFGHKIIFEVLPDGSIRTDLSYSLF